MMNKKGATISGWSEGVIIMVALVAIFGIIIADLNFDYGKTETLPFSNSTNSYLENFTAYSKTGRDELAGGETKEITQVGLSPTTYWGVTKAAFLMMFDITSGNWIPTALSSILHGWEGAVVVGRALQALFLISIIFAVIRLFVRIKP